MNTQPTHRNRRQVLKAFGATLVCAPLLAGCTAEADDSESMEPTESTPTATAASDDFDGWLADVDDATPTVDKTGHAHVDVKVGAPGNGGDFAFDPVVLHIDSETTVIWEWTGAGGFHDVAATDGSFTSEMSGEAGFTFEHTFTEAGIFKYSCTPHESLGMKGVVVVK